MRVAAEAVDDGLVAAFVLEVVAVRECGEEALRLDVHETRFAVHVGHVEEHAARRRQGLVVAAGHRLLRERERHRVAGEGARRAAEEVARELVERDDLGEPAFRRGAPVPQLAGLRRGLQRTEALAQPRVEGLVDAPPLRRLDLVEPEVQHGIGRRGHAKAPAGSAGPGQHSAGPTIARFAGPEPTT